MSFSFSGLDTPFTRTVTNFANGWSGYTVASWVKSNEISTDRGWLNLYVPDGTDDGGGTRYDNAGSTGGGNNVIKFGLFFSAGQQSSESAVDVQTTNLQFVEGRWGSSETGGNLEIWIDGVKSVLTATGNNTATILGTKYDKIHLGMGGKDDNPLRSWNGNVYEVRVYDRALTPEEIQTMFALRGADKTYHGLQAWYRDSGLAPGITIPTTAGLIKDLSNSKLDLTAGVANVVAAASPLRRSKVVV